MDAASGGKIVTRWECNVYGMPSFRVHQTNHPEIETEGRTSAEASDRLVQPRLQSTDFVGEAWRYQPVALALGDARDFNGSVTAGARTEPRLSRLPSR